MITVGRDGTSQTLSTSSGAIAGLVIPGDQMARSTSPAAAPAPPDRVRDRVCDRVCDRVSCCPRRVPGESRRAGRLARHVRRVALSY